MKVSFNICLDVRAGHSQKLKRKITIHTNVKV